MIAPWRLIRPLLWALDAETAHRLTVRALSSGYAGRARAPDDPVLRTRVFGLSFTTPVGLAAGFDKDAEALDGILRLGFGFAEAGTVTPLPQSGNPRPRLFRLVEDEAAINRFGFNSEGLAAFRARLEVRRARAGRAPGIVGANLGKNRDTVDAAADYVAGVEAVCALADYLVCNLSSPNTPGLRAMQARAPIRELLARVLEARARSAPPGRAPPPLLAKVGPDLDDRQLADIAEVALESGIDGLIVGNTTVDRPPGLRSRHAAEPGGLSGRPLRAPAERCLRAMARLIAGRLPIIGCGGIASGADAYARIRAGASLVQLYTALVYHGPGLAARINRELAALLRRDGHACVADAVGVDLR